MISFEEQIYEWIYDDLFTYQYRVGMLTALKIYYRVNREWDKADIIEDTISLMYDNEIRGIINA